MQLRHKFSLIALIYLLSLAANLILSAWCIIVYFNSAFADFETSLARERLVEQVRRQYQDELRELHNTIPPSEKRKRYYEAESQLDTAASELMDGHPTELDRMQPSLHLLIQKKNSAVSEFLASPAKELTIEQEHSFVDLDRGLANLLTLQRSNREQSVERAAAVQQRVLGILTVSAAIGGTLCVLGLLAFRKWVMRPIADLRLATREIAAGRFEYRVVPRSHDELGRLGEEVNQMSSTILEMQHRLVEKERLAASGEMLSRLTHNIRNPLGGIRALAEASVRDSVNERVAEYQNRIIDAVDRFERWLHDLQQSVSPVELKVSRVDTRSLLSGVAAAVQPMLMRRQVELATQVDSGVEWIDVDPLHFEQAVVALLVNAVQASPISGRVELSASPSSNRPNEWELKVKDYGPGIAPELHEKIFASYYTTKPDGTGMGLAMARKVVRLHGGDLRVESQAGSGSQFIAALPRRLEE